MPSLKDLKNRINSVKSTRKITKAMQMVAAAKLRRAQEAAEAARPYAARMEAVVNGLRPRSQGRDRAAAAGRAPGGQGASAGGDDVRTRAVRWVQLDHRRLAAPCQRLLRGRARP
jgi:hypothetical protein